jgi:hypothetical protein
MRALMKMAASAALFLAAGLLQASDTKEVHRTLPLARDGRVSIETFKGSVAVSTWDRPEVKIDAVIEPDGTDSDQREKVAETEIRISGSGSSVTIRSDYHNAHHLHSFLSGLFDWNSGVLPLVRYTIQMPASARLEIEDHKSDIQVSGLKSDLKLHTYKGTGRITALDGAARIETYKGDIRVEFARYSRDSRFETHKGDIEVRLPRDSRFELDADAGRRGGVESDFAMTTRAGNWRATHASGAINGGGPRMHMTTYKGTLRVRAT